MQQVTTTIVAGVFDDRLKAAEALEALRRGGFDPRQIGIVALERPEIDPDLAPLEQPGVRVDETTGILAGGVVGGFAGWLIGAATVAVPGLGALVAAGALVGVLGGAGIGAATGGLIGYLLEHGLSDAEARYYHERVRHGGILLTVRDGEHADLARQIIQEHGGHTHQTRHSG